MSFNGCWYWFVYGKEFVGDFGFVGIVVVLMIIFSVIMIIYLFFIEVEELLIKYEIFLGKLLSVVWLGGNVNWWCGRRWRELMDVRNLKLKFSGNY